MSNVANQLALCGCVCGYLAAITIIDIAALDGIAAGVLLTFTPSSLGLVFGLLALHRPD